MGGIDAQSDSADQLRPDDIFGDYRVLRSLCYGLILNYYQMQHSREGHEVTVGVFHRRTEADPAFIERLQLLQDQLSRCERGEIPKITECSVVEHRHCIFLEEVRGESLSQYYKRCHDPESGQLDSSLVARITHKLLVLLACTHTQDLDHCDLSSDSIFVAEDGELQVLGLGIKSALGVDLFESIVSASVSPLESRSDDARMSSFDVMSPEYKMGIPEDHRVDIYAVGTLGYWMLCGKKSEHSSYMPATRIVADLPEFWDAFFQKSLERDRNDRYPSCKVALQGLIGGSVTVSVLPPETESESKPVARGRLSDFSLSNRAFRLILIGLVALVFAGLGAYFVKVTFMESVDLPQVRAIEAGSERMANLRLQVRAKQVQLYFFEIDARFRSDDGRFDLFILPGEYRARIRALGYQDSVVPLTISKDRDEVYDLDLALKPVLVNFNVSSEPGATVLLINESGERVELGALNADGTLSESSQVDAGIYTVIVQKSGYETQRIEAHQILVQSDERLEVPLHPLAAEVAVRTNPEGARVYVDGVEFGRSPIRLDSLSLGISHDIRVELEGYRTVGYRLELNAGENQIIDFGELVPQVGAVRLEVSFERTDPRQVPQLKKELIVEIAGRQLSFDSPELAAIPQGIHSVRIMHPSYQSSTVQLQVKDGQQSSVALSLIPRPAQLDLILPDGLTAMILVDGKLADLSAGRLALPSNQPISLEVRIHDYLTMVRSFNLEPNEQVNWEVEPIPIPSPDVGKPWVVPYLGMEFAWVPPAVLNVGSELEESGRLSNEGPLTKVTFSRGFWAAAYEVTQAQYMQLMSAAPSQFKADNKPVESVAWADANEYCRILNEREAQANRLPVGYAYRLPTEFEWEYLARGGSDTPFSFGQNADTRNGNFLGVYPRERDSEFSRSDLYGTTAVGTFTPNAFGLYDVHGNVQEWTLSRYNARLPGGNVEGAALIQQAGASITVRGGTWQQNAVQARSAVREGLRPELKNSETGFRVVLAPQL